MFLCHEINVVGNDWIQGIGPQGRINIRIADIRSWAYLPDTYTIAINIGAVVTLELKLVDERGCGEGQSLDAFEQELYALTVGLGNEERS